MAENLGIKILNNVINWLQTQLKKRESWDEITIFVISLLALIASPILKYAAWFGLAYSGWSLWKKFKKS